jgi:hypothetical protein
MVQAYIVYFSLLILMVLFARKSVQLSFIEQRRLHLYHITLLLPILIFTCVIGCRYMVGVDYESYMEIFLEGKDGFRIHGLEFFFKWLVIFLSDHHFHFIWFFIISAFIQIFFFYKAFDKTIFMLLPFAVATFLMAELGALENGIRQFAALMIFFYALTFIKQKKVFHYLIWILAAALFHKSVLICLPLYWILNRNIFGNIFMQYFLLALAFIVSFFFLPFLDSLKEIASIFNYDHYLDKLVVEGKGGLGFYTTWTVNLLIIGFFPFLKQYFKENGFLIYWNLFFIGLLLKPFIDFIHVLSRINWYFYKFRFLILAFLLYYLYQHRKDPMNMFFFWFFFGTTILFFVYEIYTGAHWMSPFQFIWQK